MGASEVETLLLVVVVVLELSTVSTIVDFFFALTASFFGASGFALMVVATLPLGLLSSTDGIPLVVTLATLL